METQNSEVAQTQTQQNINQFLSTFNAKKEGILSGIKSANELEKGSDEMNNFIQNLYQQLDSIKKFFSDSTLLLPAYDIRQAQKAIEDLDQQLSTAKVNLMPKKKFGFKKSSTSAPKKESAPAPVTTPAEPVSLVNDDEFSISNKENTTIDFHKETHYALRIFNLKNCTVIGGPVLGSTFIDKCENCTFVLASQQIRIHTSTDCDYYLYVKSHPIIEHCDRVRFAPYNAEYPERATLFESARFDLEKNNWEKVEDFNWLKTQQSPHWSVIEPEQRRPPYQFV